MDEEDSGDADMIEPSDLEKKMIGVKRLKWVNLETTNEKERACERSRERRTKDSVKDV